MTRQRISLSEHFTIQKILRFTLPSILMMVFSSIYSIVDGFFVSNYAGPSEFAGLNFIFPYIAILGAFGFMIGTGGSALIGKYLGEKNDDKANNVFSMINVVSLIGGIILGIIGYFTVKPVSIALGASGDMLSNAVIYGKIMSIGIPFYLFQFMYQPLFIVAEKPHQGFFVTLLAGIANMLLDFIFIVLCKWSIIGAAIASVSGMAIGGILPVIYFMRKNNSLLKIGKFHFDFKDLGKLCLNGSSEFVGQIAFSIVGIAFNYQLLKYIGENGVSAYGVLMYVGFIFVAIFIGYTTSISQVTSYHFGANNKEELNSLLKKSLLIVLITGAAMFILSELLTRPISLMFVGYDEDLYNLTKRAFNIYATHFLFVGFSIYISGFFTALNDGVTSAIISFIRTLVFQILFVFIFPLIWGADSIWWAVVASEIISFIIAIIFIFLKKKKFGYL